MKSLVIQFNDVSSSRIDLKIIDKMLKVELEIKKLEIGLQKLFHVSINYD